MSRVVSDQLSVGGEAGLEGDLEGVEGQLRGGSVVRPGAHAVFRLLGRRKMMGEVSVRSGKYGDAVA
ncbi:hypothetical protein [Streptomyces hoynatensis]|uniref:hypothetical protein n=1 Tax=Streptomyces hoynatensis TaxID=1141874 RepID=UPI0011C418A1|nr:hypothetical protein [Streptomyces hoynatensis]